MLSKEKPLAMSFNYWNWGCARLHLAQALIPIKPGIKKAYSLRLFYPFLYTKNSNLNTKLNPK
jgi:hypothetical protein